MTKTHDDAIQSRRLELSERVRQGGLHAFLELGPEVLHPGTNGELSRVSYFAKGAALDDIRRWLERPLNDELRRLRLAEAGIEASQIKDLFHWMPVEGMALVTADPRTGQPTSARRSSELEAVGIPVISTILMWIMIMMGDSRMIHGRPGLRTGMSAKVKSER